MSQPEFNAPGPGVWELEQTHFSRPTTRYASELVPDAIARGFGEGTKRYGLLLDTLVMRPVNDFFYSQFRPVGAPEGAKGPPPKIIFKLLTRLHPEIRSRVRDGSDAIQKKLWRDDLKRWDTEIKPDSIQRNQRLQAVDVRKLGDDEFVKHLEELRDNVREMTYRHHIFTVSSTFPVGHFLVEARRMTGLPSGELLGLLKGSSPISTGVAAEELAEVSRALGEAGITAEHIGERSAAEVLDELRSRGDGVGTAVNDFVDRVSYRMVSGYDVCDRYALEMPGMLLRTMFASPSSSRSRAEEDEKRLERVRSRVPEKERDRFDESLGEARHINRLRDERGLYNDLWSAGLARRGILEAGRRLKENGAVPEADLAINATHDELVAMLRGTNGPSSDELRRRRTWRETKTIADAPQYLGGKPSSPPPPDWLPPRARPNAQAVAAIISELFDVTERPAVARAVEGLPVHPGVYEGRARLVSGPEDFNRLEVGDVLVTRTTGPAFNVVLPLLGALVTDRGGQLSHAAIVAREYGIPAVVGTRQATTLIADGARVRVDGDRGRVELID
jgi:phosphohistidine swiveling domain-containing protein